MTDLSFTKMHGAGNDFIVIDNRDQKRSENEIIALAPELCDRRFGIGADGIIALHKPENPALDYTMFYRNADGSDAGMCGNGARCLALFAAKKRLGSKLTFNVHDVIYEAAVNIAKQEVTILFPMQIDINEATVEDGLTAYQMYAGTEHIVLEIERDEFKNDEKLKSRGEQLRYSEQFNPPGTNVNFVTGISSTEIRIKTYEKGVENLTLACGTGAIAAALAWHHTQENEHAANPIKVYAQGGTLEVNFEYDTNVNRYSGISLHGNAEFAFEGIYEQ